jgi:site-specific recombinase XerD
LRTNFPAIAHAPGFFRVASSSTLNLFEPLAEVFHDDQYGSDRPTPLTTADIKKLVAICGFDFVGLRDKAMIPIGFAGALRRSELAGIEREQLTFTAEGLRVHLPRSKGNQARKGTEVGTSMVPVRRLAQ